MDKDNLDKYLVKNASRGTVGELIDAISSYSKNDPVERARREREFFEIGEYSRRSSNKGS